MQKTIFRTKSTIPCRDDAELASEQTYQTAFTAWQEQPSNEFSFRQPGSTTQAVFLEGMGLQEEEPAVLERRALQRISNQLGILFLHQLLAPYLVLIVCVIVFSLLGGSLSYSVHDNVLYGSNDLVLITMILRKIVRFGVPIFMAKRLLKMPKTVTCCRQKTVPSTWIRTLGITMCVFFAFGTILNFLPESSIHYITLGALSHTILCLDTQHQIFYFAFVLISRPIFETMLYNGSIMHVLRQFGDDTAVLLTATFSALMAENLVTGISTFAVSILAAREVLRYENIYVGLFSRTVYYTLMFVLFHTSIFRNNVPIPNRLLWILIIGIVGMLLGTLVIWKAPFQGSKRFYSIRSAGKCSLIFLIQANLMTICVFVSLALSVVSLIL